MISNTCSITLDSDSDPTTPSKDYTILLTNNKNKSYDAKIKTFYNMAMAIGGALNHTLDIKDLSKSPIDLNSLACDIVAIATTKPEANTPCIFFALTTHYNNTQTHIIKFQDDMHNLRRMQIADFGDAIFFIPVSDTNGWGIRWKQISYQQACIACNIIQNHMLKSKLDDF